MTPDELVAEFIGTQPYELDDFQVEAIRALANHHSVLVAAPTGTGKTVVGEFGIFMAGKGGQESKVLNGIWLVATFGAAFVHLLAVPTAL